MQWASPSAISLISTEINHKPTPRYTSHRTLYLKEFSSEFSCLTMYPLVHVQVFREVVLGSKREKGDIITFYNTYYIPIMENSLLQFQPPQVREQHEIEAKFHLDLIIDY
jgi:hypothetical protein